jgi:hypothetical protein
MGPAKCSAAFSGTATARRAGARAFLLSLKSLVSLSSEMTMGAVRNGPR